MYKRRVFTMQDQIDENGEVHHADQSESIVLSRKDYR